MLWVPSSRSPVSRIVRVLWRRLSGDSGSSWIALTGRRFSASANVCPSANLFGECSVPVLSDRQIRKLVKIEPFEDAKKRPGKISYGVSSYGYDVRVGTHFKIFTPATHSGDIAVVDPKAFSDDMMIEVDVANRPADKQYVIIPPNSFALCETVEYLDIPRDVLAICVGKSTYARCGLIVNVTPLEPEWRGKVTLEISNTTPLPARVYANEGVAQLIFLKAEDVCEKSYADKAGKYQDQSGLTLPKVD